MTPLSVNAICSFLLFRSTLFTISNFLTCCLIPALPNPPGTPPGTPPIPPLPPKPPPCPPTHPQTSPRSSLYCLIFYSDQYAHPLSAPVHSAPVHSATFLCYGQPSTPQTSPSHLTPSLFMHTLLHLNPSSPVHIPTPPPNLT